MAYRQDLQSSARRHFRAADELHAVSSAGSQPGCKAVAGYLYGVSAELAVKEIMRDSGIMPLPNAQKRSDPYYAHFPELKDLLSDVIIGRRSEELRRIAESKSLLRNWNTKMRYAHTSDIQATWVSEWKESARVLIDQMDKA